MKFDGHALRIIRRSCGFTQSYVAKKSGYSVQYVSMLENGTTAPNDVAFHRIRDVFDLSDSELAIIVAVHDSLVKRTDDKRPALQETN
jgi:transcriptional regulator with XRE-family HTH domain